MKNDKMVFNSCEKCVPIIYKYWRTNINGWFEQIHSSGRIFQFTNLKAR